MQIAAIAAARMLESKSVSKAALDCCTAMNLHKAIVLPNPLAV
jgi:hypothetical protein